MQQVPSNHGPGIQAVNPGNRGDLEPESQKKSLHKRQNCVGKARIQSWRSEEIRGFTREKTKKHEKVARKATKHAKSRLKTDKIHQKVAL